MNYQDEYGITAKINSILANITSWNRLLWTKDTLRQANRANSIGELTVVYNKYIDGQLAHLDLVEILEYCCPGCYWETSDIPDSEELVRFHLKFPKGTMEIPPHLR